MGAFDFFDDVFDAVTDFFPDAVDFIVDVAESVFDFFTPEVPDVQVSQARITGVLVNKRSNIEPIPVIYGKRRVGATIVHKPVSGASNEFIYFVLVVCEGEIDGYEATEIDGVASTDSRFAGLNSRLSEFSALLGRRSLELLEPGILRRQEVSDIFRREIGDLPGIDFQSVRPTDRCSYKDFSITVEESAFGLSRDQLRAAMEAENIDTRRYYTPPVHLSSRR